MHSVNMCHAHKRVCCKHHNARHPEKWQNLMRACAHMRVCVPFSSLPQCLKRFCSYWSMGYGLWVMGDLMYFEYMQTFVTSTKNIYIHIYIYLEYLELFEGMLARRITWCFFLVQIGLMEFFLVPVWHAMCSSLGVLNGDEFQRCAAGCVYHTHFFQRLFNLLKSEKCQWRDLGVNGEENTSCRQEKGIDWSLTSVSSPFSFRSFMFDTAWRTEMSRECVAAAFWSARLFWQVAAEMGSPNLGLRNYDAAWVYHVLLAWWNRIKQAVRGYEAYNSWFLASRLALTCNRESDTVSMMLSERENVVLSLKASLLPAAQATNWFTSDSWNGFLSCTRFCLGGCNLLKCGVETWCFHRKCMSH